MNLATLLILLLLALGIGAALRSLVRSRRRGGCADACGSCALREACQKKESSGS